jgi:renalase
MQASRPRRIGIVGGGLAGLSAARELTRLGHLATVFEKASGPGGRVATRHARGVELPRPLAGAALAFDHGAQYFTVRDPRFAEVAARWERARVAAPWTGRIVAFDAEGWEEIGADTIRYVGVPDMHALARDLAGGLDIRYGQPVSSLAPLLDAFDHVIVAIPAAEAAALVAAVPALAEPAGAVRMPPCWTVLAAFEERVAARFDAAFVNGSALGWIARNTSKPKRDWKVDAWVLHATTAWSAAHVDDPKDHVGAFLMEAFEDLVRAGLPRACHAEVHRWRHAAADPPLATGVLHDPTARVTLCGDWCRGSRIEDAWLSGVIAAELITTKHTK